MPYATQAKGAHAAQKQTQRPKGEDEERASRLVQPTIVRSTEPQGDDEATGGAEDAEEEDTPEMADEVLT